MRVVWSGYEELAQSEEHFAMARVASPADIYPVFRELFAADASSREGRSA